VRRSPRATSHRARRNEFLFRPVAGLAHCQRNRAPSARRVRPHGLCLISGCIWAPRYPSCLPFSFFENYRAAFLSIDGTIHVSRNWKMHDFPELEVNRQ